MQNPALTAGGTPLYPMGGLLNPSLPVYRPVYGGGGLLDEGRDFQHLRNNFAGGLLNGFQYNPNRSAGGTYMSPIAPSGIYTTNPDEATTVTEGDEVSPLTNRDALTLMYGTQLGQDYTELSGLPQQQAYYAQLILGDGSGIAPGNRDRYRDNLLGGLDLDATYDPTAENWKSLMNRMNASVRSGGGDGGA